MVCECMGVMWWAALCSWPMHAHPRAKEFKAIPVVRCTSPWNPQTVSMELHYWKIYDLLLYIPPIDGDEYPTAQWGMCLFTLSLDEGTNPPPCHLECLGRGGGPAVTPNHCMSETRYTFLSQHASWWLKEKRCCADLELRFSFSSGGTCRQEQLIGGEGADWDVPGVSLSPKSRVFSQQWGVIQLVLCFWPQLLQQFEIGFLWSWNNFTAAEPEYSDTSLLIQSLLAAILLVFFYEEHSTTWIRSETNPLQRLLSFNHPTYPYFNVTAFKESLFLN